MKTSSESRRRLRGHSSLRQLFCALADAPGKSWHEAARDDLAEELSGRDAGGWRMVTRGARLRWLIGKLWICTSIMPAATCQDMELPQGSTYAQGVRKLREAMLREAGLRESGLATRVGIDHTEDDPLVFADVQGLLDAAASIVQAKDRYERRDRILEIINHLIALAEHGIPRFSALPKTAQDNALQIARGMTEHWPIYPRCILKSAEKIHDIETAVACREMLKRMDKIATWWLESPEARIQ